MEIPHRLEPPSAPDIGVDRLALDGTGPNERDLMGEVGEIFRLEPDAHTHLSGAFDLEETHGVTLLKAPPYLVLERRVPDFQPDLFGAVHLFPGALDGAEHPQAEQV